MCRDTVYGLLKLKKLPYDKSKKRLTQTYRISLQLLEYSSKVFVLFCYLVDCCLTGGGPRPLLPCCPRPAPRPRPPSRSGG